MACGSPAGASASDCHAHRAETHAMQKEPRLPSGQVPILPRSCLLHAWTGEAEGTASCTQGAAAASAAHGKAPTDTRGYDDRGRQGSPAAGHHARGRLLFVSASVIRTNSFPDYQKPF